MCIHTQANTAAARELLRTEAALMGLSLTPEQLERADLGRVLDAAHETIHKITTSSSDRHTIGLAALTQNPDVSALWPTPQHPPA